MKYTVEIEHDDSGDLNVRVKDAGSRRGRSRGDRLGPEGSGRAGRARLADRARTFQLMRRRPRFTPQARLAGAALLAAILAPALYALISNEEAGLDREEILTIVWSEGSALIERRGEP